MIVHLQYNHRPEFLKVKAKANHAAQLRSASSDRQPTITEALHHLQPLPQNSKRWKALTNSICYCIGKDMLPFSTVNNVGFRKMLYTFEPRYVLPDRKAFSHHYIPEIYEKERLRIANAMKQGVKYFSVTTDGWTSRANHSYITHTIHYVDELWNLQSHLLDTVEITTEHTAINLADELQESFARWNLSDECLVAVTTDNARNIVNAVEVLSWQHFGCFAHTLQLGVKKSMEIPQVSKALARARRVVSHFHHSSKSYYILKQKQIDLHTDQLNLIQDVTTRWNSSYYMVERLIQQQQPLCAALIEVKKTELMPSDVEVSVMETFLEVLKPIVEITETLGGEKLVTMSAVKPLLHKLLSIHLIEKSRDTQLAKTIKSTLLGDLKERYKTAEVKNLINKACLLDPRFKALSFLPQTDKNSIISMVEEEAQKIVPTNSSAGTAEDDTILADPPAKKSKQQKRGLMSLLEDVITSDTTLPLSKKAEIEKEMHNYLCIDTTPGKSEKSGNPLNWWRDNEKYFPLLAQMARKYLCVPATSVPSERAFSIAGHVVNEKRSCLLPENVNILVFLAANLELK